jgi:hypothetical protein
MSTWLTKEGMNHDTGKERNRVFLETSNSRGYVQQGTDHVTLGVGLWEHAFATSTTSGDTPKHHYHHPSFKNNEHCDYTLTKWDEKTSRTVKSFTSGLNTDLSWSKKTLLIFRQTLFIYHPPLSSFGY